MEIKYFPLSTFIFRSLIHFSLSAIHFKFGCRQSKVNRLFNLFSPCLYTLSCEIAEQQPRQYRDFENIQRAHICLQSFPRTTLTSFIYAVCSRACVNLEWMCESLFCATHMEGYQSVSLDLVGKFFTGLRERFCGHDISPAWTIQECNHMASWCCPNHSLGFFYGVLMPGVYRGFMTSVARRGSAHTARGFHGKQSELSYSWQTLHHSQGQEALHFLEIWRCASTHSLSWPLSNSSFCSSAGALESSHGRVFFHLFVRQPSHCSLLCPRLICALRWQYDHFISVDHCFSTSESRGFNGPPAARHSTITFQCVSEFCSSLRHSTALTGEEFGCRPKNWSSLHV